MSTAANKWAAFDDAATKASAAQDTWRRFNSDRMQHYGNTITDPGMISGNVWPNWSDDDRKRNKELLAIFYDAQDAALQNRPARVHKTTALRRLKEFLEH